VKLAGFPADLVEAARKVAGDVLGEMAARDKATANIYKSYAEFRARTAAWSQVSLAAVLQARG
jgi:TRAP-type mannitol/chloroaromatic compound transport system substrate-binding protein